MLVMKVEVWPHGEEDKSFEIARVGVVNVTRQLAEFSDYEAVALLREGGKETILRTEIAQHETGLGWLPLVRRVLTNLFLGKDLARPAAYGDPMADLLRKDGHGTRS